MSGITRVPDLLFTSVANSTINRTNVQLFELTQQLSTGRALSHPSDDPVRAALVLELDGRLERSEQRLQNLQITRQSLSAADDALNETTDLLNEAYSLALEQLNLGVTADERTQQAAVVNSLLDGLLAAANRESIVGHVFGGAAPGTAPVTRDGEAYVFTGDPGVLLTDSAPGGLPATITASNAVAAVSGRVRSGVDLQPQLTADTLLSDLRGSSGLGVAGGPVTFSFGGGASAMVDLSGADTVGDVIDLLQKEIQDYEIDAGVTILGPGGVGLSGNSISIDVPTGSLSFAAPTGSSAANDIGLIAAGASEFSSTRTVGEPLDPKLTLRTPVSALGAVTLALGTVRITNNGVTTDVDLSTAQSIGEVKTLIESSVDGVRVAVNAGEDGIDLVSTLSGDAGRSLSVSEMPGDGTAGQLGIRSLDLATRLSDFNFGRGVGINTDEPQPERNVDFTITLGDGFEIDIDLRDSDVATVGTLVTAINTQAAAALTAAGRPAGDFVAGIGQSQNGISLTQSPLLGGAVSVTQRHNSPAAEDLGLLDGTYDSATATFVGDDRAKVRVNSVFSDLADFRTALLSDDRRGIEIAAERIRETLDGVTQTRATVGGFARRVEDELTRAEDRVVADETVRSEARDVDFAAASSRFTLLQTQLQAGLQVTALSSQLTLLDFLG